MLEPLNVLRDHAGTVCVHLRINYPHVLAEIHRTGITGPIGLELNPRGDRS